MPRLVILSVLLISSLAAAAPPRAEEVSDSTTIATTIKIETEAPVTTVIDELTTTTTAQVSPSSSSSTTENNSLEVNSHESSEEDDDSSHEVPLIPIRPSSSLPAKRKVLYINQQQSGKLNVHLELNDVSLIVIPNKKDPQLSLLNLLLKSAQKSNLKHNVEKKKEENAKVNVQQQHNHDDDYSQKYKMDNYMHAVASSEPSIESRAPYRVDITSTLNQPIVDIMNNGKFQSQEEFARSPPMVKLLKPISIQPHGRIYKRSIDRSFLRFNPDVLDDRSISQNSSASDDEEQQELINSIESNQNINGEDVEGEEEDLDSIGSSSGFVLLGAVEDCGPGRRRNSYMICVAIEE